MTTKLKIKMGGVEIDYEGTEEFLKIELAALLAAVSELYERSDANAEDKGSGNSAGSNGNGNGTMSMTTVASRLACKTGPDLVLAAAARLTLFLAKPAFTRDEIVEQLKSATGYFKQSYINNLTGSLVRLVKDGKLNEQAKDTFTLPTPTTTDLTARLAQ